MKLKELLEKRAEAAKRIYELRDKAHDDKHEWTAQDEENWTAANKAYDELGEQIEKAKRAEEIEKTMAASLSAQTPGLENADSRDQARAEDSSEMPTNRDRRSALQGWLRHHSGLDVDERNLDAAKRCGLHLGRKMLDIRLFPTAPRTFEEIRSRDAQEERALSAIDGSKGGFTAPDEFVNSLETNLLAFGGVRQVAEIIRTSHGNDLPWPTADDTSNTGEQVGESASAATEAEPTFGQITWKAYKFSSKLVKVPTELLEDSAFDIATWLGRALGERIGRIQNTRFTTGTGAATANGIVTASSLGVTAVSSTVVDSDELLEMAYSIDDAYMVNAKWMMHKNIILAIRKLKDGDGQYIWARGLDAGEPDSLFRHPIARNTDMASAMASTAKTALFGQLSKYKIREVNTIRMYRLVERYRENDQDGFIAFLRGDGNLLDAGTHPVKHLIHT